MSLHDVETSIEVDDPTYARLAGAAAAQGKTPSYVLDTIVTRALEREQSAKQSADFDAERARTSTVLCSCCHGTRCQKTFVWRGVVRCGCANNPIRP
jgi:hypothetical protein